MNRKRPTVGFFTYTSRGPVWIGCVKAAIERDANLMGIAGWWLDTPFEFHKQANVLYDLVGPESVDGLVIWTSALGTYIGKDATRAFCERYRALPVISLGMLVPGIPSIVVDDRQGIRDLMSHLIDVHHCRKVAFVMGPQSQPEMAARYQAYCEMLEAANLPLDPGLVVSTLDETNEEVTARDIVEKLIGQGQGKFDSILTASGSLAPAIIDSLQSYGLSVPENIRVVSFGQSFETTLPLTSASYPYFEQGRLAVSLLMDILSGIQVPLETVLSSNLVIGETCGCLDPKVTQAGLNSPTQSQPSNREALLNEIKSAATGLVANLEPDWAENLLDGFLSDTSGSTQGCFIALLESLLSQSAEANRGVVILGGELVLEGGDLTIWQQVVTLIRRSYQSLISPAQSIHAENLLHQARVVVGNVAQRAQAYQNLHIRSNNAVGEINQALSATLDRNELMSVLANELPKIDIPACYLALYENPQQPATWARLILASNPNKRAHLGADGLRFPSRQLIPQEYLPTDRRYNLIVEALYFREKQQGFVAFEIPQLENTRCQLIRAQISIALEGVQLFQRNIELYNQAVEARRAAEEADRLKSTFLSTVSHELRTPLVLISGLSEMMLKKQASRHPASSPADQQDLERIHISAQHLDRLIRDVLDLASSQVGQLKLLREPLDMVETLRAVTLMGESLAQEKGLRWQAQIPETLPHVWGDRTRIRQVALNLVSNAVKFTEHGDVSLEVETQKGEIVIKVSDTGMGISAEDQPYIFDEFRRSEQATQRGYSGMGLGLAVSKRLVELHGGRISVQSPGKGGRGSTITVRLPAIEELSTASGVAETLSARAHSVLVLTQAAGRSEALLQHLGQEGFIADEIPIDDESAWMNSILAAPPGALILNLNPDSQKGWDVLKVIKENPATQDIPVIFYVLGWNKQGGTVLDFDYLMKPVAMETLAKAVERQGLWEPGKGPRTILVVDDEPGILDIHSRAVHAQYPACRVLKAANGREALDIIRRELPDLVLLDLMMPVMNGFDVLEAMREGETTRRIPVIVLTAQVLTGRDIARLNRGVAAVLGKGVFRLDEMMAHVEATLKRHKRLGTESQRIARKAMAYIHEHYADELSRQDIATHAGVSERYLTRCFNQEAGMTPSTYLTRYRINQACKLLENTDKAITEIAFAVGFSSGSYFGQVFLQQIGLTPHAYREQGGRIQK
jgi:signal transduction histidine kinase/AraC-like DNA-binding protein